MCVLYYMLYIAAGYTLEELWARLVRRKVIWRLLEEEEEADDALFARFYLGLQILAYVVNHRVQKVLQSCGVYESVVRIG